MGHVLDILIDIRVAIDDIRTRMTSAAAREADPTNLPKEPRLAK